jgi:hypothetical protein
VIAILVLAAHAATAACPPQGTANEDVTAAVTASLAGFSEGYEDRFRAGLDDAHSSLACLTEVLPPADAAALLRVDALGAFADGRRDAAVTAFRSALALDPYHVMSPELAPPGGPIDAMYQEAATADSPPSAAIDDQGYQVFVDGKKTPMRPLDAPSVVQFLRADGTVRWSGVVDQAGQLPTLEPDSSAAIVARPPPPPPPKTEPELPDEPLLTSTTQLDKGGWRANIPLLATAGGAAILGGSLLLAGQSTKGAYTDTLGGCVSSGCDTTWDELEAQRARANTLGVAGQSTLAVAAGLGVIAIAIPW